LVCRGQSIRKLYGQFNQPVRLYRPAVDFVFEGMAFEQLHHDKRPPILLADFVDGANIRMVERGSRARLALKALQRMRALRQVLGEKL
jgi:hypothetical protein